MTIEEFLNELPKPIVIVGGSPLHKNFPGPFDITLNAKGSGYATAINNSKSDAYRATKWKYVLQPNPIPRVHAPDLHIWGRVQPFGWGYKSAIRPRISCPLPKEFPSGVQPTTYFSLLLICQELQLPVTLLGVCGYASKFHDGDWEMHYIKTKMKNVTVHDPRPRW